VLEVVPVELDQAGEVVDRDVVVADLAVERGDIDQDGTVGCRAEQDGEAGADE